MLPLRGACAEAPLRAEGLSMTGFVVAGCRHNWSVADFWRYVSNSTVTYDLEPAVRQPDAGMATSPSKLKADGLMKSNLKTSELRLKEKKPGMRACDEKNAKGELCCGHLKRWHAADPEIVKQVGKDVQIYRCERCHTLYRPAPNDDSSAGLRYELRPVSLLGAFLRRKPK